MQRACSSARLERFPDKEEVGGSSPPRPTQVTALAAIRWLRGHPTIAVCTAWHSAIFVQALRLAQSAADRPLACSVMSAMSHQATYLGPLTEAANLARAAHQGLRDTATPALTAQFLAMEARALARAGDTRGCHAALIAADQSHHMLYAWHGQHFGAAGLEAANPAGW